MARDSTSGVQRRQCGLLRATCPWSTPGPSVGRAVQHRQRRADQAVGAEARPGRPGRRSRADLSAGARRRRSAMAHTCRPCCQRCGSRKRTLNRMAWNSARKAELTEKIAAGERLTRQDGEDLYDCDDLAWLGAQAHGVRTKKNGDVVYFNVNRHLNLTNVCRASCAYCSFERKPGAKDAYTMRVEEAVELASGHEGRRPDRAAHRQRPAPDAAVEVLPAGAARAQGRAARRRAQGVHRDRGALLRRDLRA